jgi:hypothetical protein
MIYSILVNFRNKYNVIFNVFVTFMTEFIVLFDYSPVIVHEGASVINFARGTEFFNIRAIFFLFLIWREHFDNIIIWSDITLANMIPLPMVNIIEN